MESLPPRPSLSVSDAQPVPAAFTHCPVCGAGFVPSHSQSGIMVCPNAAAHRREAGFVAAADIGLGQIRRKVAWVVQKWDGEAWVDDWFYGARESAEDYWRTAKGPWRCLRETTTREVMDGRGR